MPPWDEGCRGVEQCCPLGFQPHTYHGSWVMAQGKGLALGPQASAMWSHDFQMVIPGLELTLPQHPSAQNRCRPHLASGECQLACGCVYGAASDTLVDMLRPGGSETTCSYVDWPWVWGTPELAPHVQCGHRLAPGGGGEPVLSAHVQSLDTGTPNASWKTGRQHHLPSVSLSSSVSSLAPGPPRMALQ